MSDEKDPAFELAKYVGNLNLTVKLLHRIVFRITQELRDPDLNPNAERFAEDLDAILVQGMVDDEGMTHAQALEEIAKHKPNMR